MLEGLPIMLALCFMLWHAYYAPNYAGIIDAGLAIRIVDRIASVGLQSPAFQHIFSNAIRNCVGKFLPFPTISIVFLSYFN